METSGNVAKHFNKVAKLDKIDESTSNIKKEITKLNNSISTQEENLNGFMAELQSFPNIEEIDLELEKLENLEKVKNQNFKTTTTINGLVEDYSLNNFKNKRA